MGHRSGKFGVRIRKMKPQPITVKRRQAWGKSEKKEETVLGTLLVSLICFQIFCISRKNRYAESDDDENATTTNPEHIQVCTCTYIFPINLGLVDLLNCCMLTFHTGAYNCH